MQHTIVEDGNPVTKNYMPITLAFDHRVNDGGDAGRFLNFMREHLQDPALFLVDVV